MARKGVKVHPLKYGGYVVRGTKSQIEAVEAVNEYQEIDEGAPDMLVPPVRRVGLFRWNPCSPDSCLDGGHRVHLAHCHDTGPGVWEGVLLQSEDQIPF